MLYGPDGCRGDVRFGDSVIYSLQEITDELKKMNRKNKFVLVRAVANTGGQADILENLYFSTLNEAKKAEEDFVEKLRENAVSKNKAFHIAASDIDTHVNVDNKAFWVLSIQEIA